MKQLTVIEWIASVLVIVGAINWGLVGLFKLDLVALIFGSMSIISRLVYCLVGVAGFYLIFALGMYRDK